MQCLSIEKWPKIPVRNKGATGMALVGWLANDERLSAWSRKNVVTLLSPVCTRKHFSLEPCAHGQQYNTYEQPSNEILRNGVM